MPGSSLWLLPPDDDPLKVLLTKLIRDDIPQQFPDATPRPPVFSPHLTLTSGIDPAVYGDDPQAWLESISFPAASDVRVEFETVKTEDVYYRRCYLKVGFDGVRDAAGIARARGVLGEEDIGQRTEEWLAEWKQSFGPHVSLMYGDMPIEEGKLKQLERVVQEAGVSLAESPGPRIVNGWKGGVVWLVPTDKSITEWKPIALKDL